MTAHRHGNPGNNGPTFLALMSLVAAGFGLLFLSSMVLPQITALLGVLFGLFLLVGFHYLLWGRWLSRLIPPEDDSDRGPGESL